MKLGRRRRRIDKMRQWCVRAFLLFLVECTILCDKRNKHINLIWHDAMWDMTRIHE
jgi:hypothetical protein